MRFNIVDGKFIDVAVRQWELPDTEPLAPMILDCLAVNYAAGADMEPTTKNALVLLQMGIQAAERGEPCLVGVADSKVIGYTCWLEMPNPLGMDFRGRILHGFGTYVLPEFRQFGVSHHLRNAAEGQAARLGFTKVVGVAYHEPGIKSVLARGYRPVGTLVEKEVR